MAGSINTGYNVAAASVPVNKYIQNAAHVGVAQQTAKETTAAASTESTVEIAHREPAQGHINGLKREILDDNSTLWKADSGLAMKTDPNGNITGFEVPGEGSIQVGEGNSAVLRGADGSQTQVSLYQNEGELGGFKYTRKDGVDVHVDLQRMQLGFLDSDKNDPSGSRVLQQIEPDGGQHILTSGTFRDPKGKAVEIRTESYITPEGELLTKGPRREGLQIQGRKLVFRNPFNSGFKVDYDLPVAVTKIRHGSSQPQPATDNIASLAPKKPAQLPKTRPEVFVETPANVMFHRHPNGGSTIQLRNGLTLDEGTRGCYVKDLRSGASARVTPEAYTSVDGRTEKLYRFSDADGNRYRMFGESMDVLIESADGRARQHILPNGTILGVVQGDDGRNYKFEITPRGRYKTDPGLQMAPSPSFADVGQATVMGANGQPQVIKLPYPIPGTHTNAAYYADQYGHVNFPLSGEQLNGFDPAPGPNPPTAPVTPPPAPTPEPPASEPEASIFPEAGQPQAPVSPNFIDRLKYLFSADEAALNGGQMQGLQAQPQTQGYAQGPGFSTPQPTPPVQQPPHWGGTPTGPNNVFMGMGPTGTFPTAGGYNPFAGTNAMAPESPNPVPSYPGSYPTVGSPTWSGQLPAQPGMMPSIDAYINKSKWELEMNHAMMSGQVMANGHNLALTGMMQGAHSMLSGLTWNMAMMPRSFFYNPFLF